MKKNIFDLDYLQLLLKSSAPSSNEMAASEVFRNYLGSKAEQIVKDNIGNTIAITNSDRTYKILLSAHIDEVGFQISDICNDGLLRIRKIGGINTANLNGHTVNIITDHGSIEGTLVCKTDGENNVIPTIEAFYIDINASSREEAEEIISIGDYITFSPSFTSSNDVITSKSIDNRIGIFIISQAFSHLSGHLKNIQLLAAATTQEEIGLRGMALVAQETSPDICINLDVTDALQIGKEGLPEINKGVVVYKNADSNPSLKKFVINCAKENDIPYQISLGRNITGGTDCSRIQLFSPQTAVAELAIPCKYIHSHNEKCGLKDIVSCIDLICAVILSIDRCLSNNKEIDFTF